MQEYCLIANGWSQEATLPSAVPNTPLDSLAWTDGNGELQLRVYYEANGIVNEAMWNSNGWGTGAGSTRSGEHGGG